MQELKGRVRFAEVVKQLLTERKMALAELTMTRAVIAEVIKFGGTRLDGREGGILLISLLYGTTFERERISDRTVP